MPNYNGKWSHLLLTVAKGPRGGCGCQRGQAKVKMNAETINSAVCFIQQKDTLLVCLSNMRGSGFWPWTVCECTQTIFFFTCLLFFFVVSNMIICRCSILSVKCCLMVLAFWPCSHIHARSILLFDNVWKWFSTREKSRMAMNKISKMCFGEWVMSEGPLG